MGNEVIALFDFGHDPVFEFQYGISIIALR
jgi:hypothetical protein